MAETNKVILIVEDELSLRNALRDKLRHEGFGTLEAKDGEEGLQLALSQRPDLILLDLVMPKMDGIAMLKQMKNDEQWGKKAKVIILTNLNDYDKLAEVMTLGTYDYLVKSDWKIGDVLKKIKDKFGM